MNDTVIKQIVVDVDQFLSELLRQKLEDLGDERRDLYGEIKNWANKFAGENGFQIRREEKKEPYRGQAIILENGEKYVITVNDPLGKPPNPLPAESATGIDYGVEFPIGNGFDKLVFVQSKSRKNVVPPKQYFSMGALYSYVLYLHGIAPWVDRLGKGASYVSKRRNPHKEFLFIKIFDEGFYIPISSIMRTFDNTSGGTYNNLEYNPKGGMLNKNEKSVLADFSDLRQHLSEFYSSVNEFMKAVMDCKVGLVHEKEPNIVDRKAKVFYEMAMMTGNPNIGIFKER